MTRDLAADLVTAHCASNTATYGAQETALAILSTILAIVMRVAAMLLVLLRRLAIARAMLPLLGVLLLVLLSAGVVGSRLSLAVVSHGG